MKTISKTAVNIFDVYILNVNGENVNSYKKRISYCVPFSATTALLPSPVERGWG